MALRLAHIYLPKETSGFLDDLKEEFSSIEHYEIEEKPKAEEASEQSEKEASRIYREELYEDINSVSTGPTLRGLSLPWVSR